ncbi:uncharacterized protein CFAP97D1 [Chanos chanos]|uniref:Uncharacterized protein CFAP97D1 n=1 Tax=Chanos chanos TaxID=29144 RepID=A0A6J2WGK5_CHACN|nr:uncharacterized protein CFAP97D1-like [Chanos chanos]
MQHRSYQPTLPCASKYLQYNWDRTNYDMHREKVKSAKATICITPPKTHGHLVTKMKKLKLEENRLSAIQRENSMLLQKINHIMQTTRADNRSISVKKSLSADKRQQELLRITKENQMILQRLTNCVPHYSVQQWHEQWLKTLELMESITRYPHKSHTPVSSGSLT